MSNKPNAMIARLEAKIRAEMQAEYELKLAEMQAEYELKLNIGLQMSLDAACFAANEVFKIGPSRSEPFNDSYANNFREMNRLLSEDGKDDEDLVYSTEVIDRRLKEIVGPALFVPWDARYEA